MLDPETARLTIREIETLLAQPRHPAIARVMKQAQKALLEATGQAAPAPMSQEMPDSNGVYWLWFGDGHGDYWKIVVVELLRVSPSGEKLFQWSPIGKADWRDCAPWYWIKLNTPPSPQKG